jgi:hypothetical protein
VTTTLRSGWFCFLIRPSVGQWEVSFAGGGTRFLYATQAEAVQVARNAAQQQWEKREEPSCVCLDAPGRPIERIATFGEPA